MFKFFRRVIVNRNMNVLIRNNDGETSLKYCKNFYDNRESMKYFK